MVRTQIHLDADVVELLDREAGRTGASRAELIRRAVGERYGGDAEPYAVRFERAMASAFGAWKNRRFDSGEEYVRALRSGDWDVIDG